MTSTTYAIGQDDFESIQYPLPWMCFLWGGPQAVIQALALGIAMGSVRDAHDVTPPILPELGHTPRSPSRGPCG